MDSGESLGIYLQTIRTLMNSRIYQQQDNQNKSELEMQEEQQFLSQLCDSLVDLQEKLVQDRNEKEEQYEEKKERQMELFNQLHQESEILEQQNQELQKVLQNEDEQHILMTQQLAKSQLENFQGSKVLQELDNELYESNRYKIKTEEMNLQNKLMKEKKLQLLNQEKIYKSQIEDQHNIIKKLHKDHLQIEAQYRMFESKLKKMKKDQEDQMYENQKSKQNISQIQSQCRQLAEQNQALMAQWDSLQFQMEEALADHNIIMPISHLQQNGIPLPNENPYDNLPQNHLVKGSSGNYEHIVTSLKDELGDQFSDTFFSPISSVTETERDELNMGYHKISRFNYNPAPFMLDDQQQQNYYESSGGTTEQSSTNTRSSEPPCDKNIPLDNPVRRLNKVMLASDFDNQYQNEDEIPIEEETEYDQEEAQCSKENNDSQHKFIYPNGYLGNRYFKQKNGYHQGNGKQLDNTPKKLNNQDIQQICSNIIGWLTFKPLLTLKSSHLLH